MPSKFCYDLPVFKDTTLNIKSLLNLFSHVNSKRLLCVVKGIGISTMLAALSGCHYVTGLLDPKGVVASDEKKLLIDTMALMLIVVIPVIIMSFAFAWHYRKRNKKAKYSPNWAHSKTLEAICWGIPCVIIVILGVITWISTHQLDPYRKLNIKGKPLLVQAVALPWKWLFLYPEQKVAAQNKLVIPQNRQVEFWITSDNVPMSAFFIPQLGSQIYSMAGMRTKLHLYSQHIGTYDGMNTQYNGAGFSDMHFQVQVVSQQAFKKWSTHLANSDHKVLNLNEYKKIRKPQEKAPVVLFSNFRKGLFKRIIMQYMKPNHLI